VYLRSLSVDEKEEQVIVTILEGFVFPDRKMIAPKYPTNGQQQNSINCNFFFFLFHFNSSLYHIHLKFDGRGFLKLGGN
jgi:hypothetical protein